MKKRLLKTVISVVLTVSAMFSSVMTVFAAPAKITVSEDEYNVYVGEYPADLGAVYAKFNSKKSNVESYELVMWDDSEAEEIMNAAFTKSGMSANDYNMIPMSIVLYQEDPNDGEQYPVTSSNPMTLICELPTEYEGVEDRLKIYVLKADGRLEAVPYTLVNVDDYICTQFTINRFTQYVFAVSNADINAYEGELYASDNVAVPTSAPTKAPTSAATKAPTKAPTTAPIKVSSSSQSSSGNKDSVPKTGDDFSTTAAGAAMILAGVVLTGVLIYLKKK